MQKKNNEMIYKITQIVLSVLSGVFLFLPYMTVNVAFFGGFNMVGKDFLNLIFKYTDAMNSYGVFDLMGGDAGVVKFIMYLHVTLVLIPIIVSVISIVIAIISDKKFLMVQGIIQTVSSVGVLVMLLIMYSDVETAHAGIGVYLQILLGIGMIAGGILLKKYATGSNTGSVGGTTARSILVIAGQYAGANVSLEKPLVIGRDSSISQLVLNNPKASKKHCMITYDGLADKYFVEDFSTNGVYKRNGERIPSGRKVAFNHGEEFVIKNDQGDEVFQLQ